MERNKLILRTSVLIGLTGATFISLWSLLGITIYSMVIAFFVSMLFYIYLCSSLLSDYINEFNKRQEEKDEPIIQT